MKTIHNESTTIVTWQLIPIDAPDVV